MINLKHADHAVARLALLEFFPSEVVARAELAKLMMRIVSTPEELEWLVTTMINHFERWRGPKEMRGLFCTRFRPADGVEETCTVAGFTALDSESGYLEQFSADRRKELEAARVGELRRLN